jgi:hypothetical protein
MSRMKLGVLLVIGPQHLVVMCVDDADVGCIGLSH